MNQAQAKALGDPTRHRIYQTLVEAEGPLEVKELTALFPFNHNAIRQHLALLVGCGLVTEATSPPRGRGRPAKLYTAGPEPEHPYRRLSLLLLEAARSGDDPVEVGRREGGRTVADPGESPVDSLLGTIRRGGFDPTLQVEGHRLQFILNHCPFAEAAAAHPDTVCAIHLGIAQGLAERFEGVDVAGLDRRDPHQAGCVLTLTQTA